MFLGHCLSLLYKLFFWRLQFTQGGDLHRADACFRTEKYPRQNVASDLKLSKRADCFVGGPPMLPNSLLIPQAVWTMIINSLCNIFLSKSLLINS